MKANKKLDPENGPTGGRWTIWNRVVCLARGHKEPPQGTATRGATFDIYLCARCNDISHLVEWRTGLRYSDLGQYLDERAR